MPFIGTFFSWLAPTLTLWFVQFFGRKLLVVTTSIATFIFLTAALIVCIKHLVLTLLALAILPAWVSAGIGVFLPGNFATVLSTIIGAKSCRWAYDKAMEKMRLVNSAS